MERTHCHETSWHRLFWQCRKKFMVFTVVPRKHPKSDCHCCAMYGVAMALLPCHYHWAAHGTLSTRWGCDDNAMAAMSFHGAATAMPWAFMGLPGMAMALHGTAMALPWDCPGPWQAHHCTVKTHCSDMAGTGGSRKHMAKPMVRPWQCDESP